jgi:hypothetical protein
LWQEALSAKARVGVNEKMLCFNNNGFPTARAAHSFPGSGLITEPSRSSFAGLWHVIAFGKAEQARAALEKQGIDFFLIDFNRKFFGCIPFSPLFEPRHLGERFDLVWARGTVCLLTWHGRGTGQIPPEYVDYMSQRVEQWHQRPEDHSDRLFGQQYQSMKALYDFNQGRDYPLKRMQNLLHVHEWE